MPTETTTQPETINIGDQPIRLPFADLLPDLTPAEYDALKSDIAERGIMVPIMLAPVDDDGAQTVFDAIDGQHRLRIAAELGIAFDALPWRLVTGTPDELTQLAYNLNANRRQLTKEQRDAAAVKLRQAGLSYRKIANTIGVSTETARRAALAAGEDAQPDAVTGADGKQYESISEDTKIKQAREFVEAMIDDGVTVSAAALDDTADFRRIGIPAQRILSLLVADHVIRPNGNRSYTRLINDEIIDRVRAELQRKPGTEISMNEIIQRLDHKLSRVQVSEALLKLGKNGEALRGGFGWHLSAAACEDLKQQAAEDAPDVAPDVAPEDVIERVREALTTAGERGASAIEMWRNGPTKEIPIQQIGAACRRLTELGEAESTYLGWRLIDPAPDQADQDAQSDAQPAPAADNADQSEDGQPDPARVLGTFDGQPVTAANIAGNLNEALTAMGTEFEVIPAPAAARAARPPKPHAPAPDFATWTPDESDLKLVRAAIRHALYEHPDREDVTQDELATKTGYETWKVFRACTQMVNDGLLTSPRYGVWTPTPSYQLEQTDATTDQADGTDQRHQDHAAGQDTTAAARIEAVLHSGKADVKNQPTPEPLPVDAVREYMIEVFRSYSSRGLGRNEVITRTIGKAHGINTVNATEALQAMLEAGNVVKFISATNWEVYQLADYAETLIAELSDAVRVAAALESSLEIVREEIELITDMRADFADLAESDAASLAHNVTATRDAVAELLRYLDGVASSAAVN